MQKRSECSGKMLWLLPFVHVHKSARTVLTGRRPPSKVGRVCLLAYLISWDYTTHHSPYGRQYSWAVCHTYSGEWQHCWLCTFGNHKQVSVLSSFLPKHVHYVWLQVTNSGWWWPAKEVILIHVSLALYPGHTQLSVAFSTVKRGEPGIFSHVSMT